jgi:hypothetical protein
VTGVEVPGQFALLLSCVQLSGQEAGQTVVGDARGGGGLWIDNGVGEHGGT